MPDLPDPADTARLNLASHAPLERPSNAIDDTTDLGQIGLSGARRVDDSLDVRRYAEGILRVYRARTIMSRGPDADLSWHSLSYIEALEPGQLPPVARPAFFELTYFLRLHGLRENFDHAAFRSRVSDLAAIVDGFLDDVFLSDAG